LVTWGDAGTPMRGLWRAQMRSFDQGIAFAGCLANKGIRVIAMSRFGYLQTPMPIDASAEAQADAHVCLLDALGIQQAAIAGGSAGAPSALQMAIFRCPRPQRELPALSSSDLIKGVTPGSGTTTR
jgi:pimeloyl-ACP methyl ester carboxylesterase